MLGQLRRGVSVLVAVLLVAACANALITYSGSLATDFEGANAAGADGLLVGEGLWATDPLPTLFSWEVSQMDSGDPWMYHYTLTVPKGGLSHLNLEWSADLTADDIIDVGSTPDFEKIEVKTHPAGDEMGGAGNPGQPASLYGPKFDEWDDIEEEEGEPLVFELWLTVDREPMWGDFYAKDGSHGQVWNAGFTVTDPTDAASDGSIMNHILVPDTTNGDGNGDPQPPPGVPEPTTMTFMALCLGGLYAKHRGRKK